MMTKTPPIIEMVFTKIYKARQMLSEALDLTHENPGSLYNGDELKEMLDDVLSKVLGIQEQSFIDFPLEFTTNEVAVTIDSEGHIEVRGLPIENRR